MKRYRKSAHCSHGFYRPHYKLLREVQGRGDDDERCHELDRLEKAIAEVHEQHGLQCGPALASSAPLKAIRASTEVAGAGGSQTSEPEQLLLLAA